MANAFKQLEAFGLGPLHAEKMWKRDEFWSQESPWLTELYGSQLSTVSINRSQKELSQEVKDLIETTCGDVARQIDAITPKTDAVNEVLAMVS